MMTTLLSEMIPKRAALAFCNSGQVDAVLKNRHDMMPRRTVKTSIVHNKSGEIFRSQERACLGDHVYKCLPHLAVRAVALAEHDDLV